jgi:hypothetical protein
MSDVNLATGSLKFIVRPCGLSPPWYSSFGHSPVPSPRSRGGENYASSSPLSSASRVRLQPGIETPFAGLSADRPSDRSIGESIDRPIYRPGPIRPAIKHQPALGRPGGAFWWSARWPDTPLWEHVVCKGSRLVGRLLEISGWYY